MPVPVRPVRLGRRLATPAILVLVPGDLDAETVEAEAESVTSHLDGA